jgi:hypothetical protein
MLLHPWTMWDPESQCCALLLIVETTPKNAVALPCALEAVLEPLTESVVVCLHSWQLFDTCCRVIGRLGNLCSDLAAVSLCPIISWLDSWWSLVCWSCSGLQHIVICSPCFKYVSLMVLTYPKLLLKCRLHLLLWPALPVCEWGTHAVWYSTTWLTRMKQTGWHIARNEAFQEQVEQPIAVWGVTGCSFTRTEVCIHNLL